MRIIRKRARQLNCPPKMPNGLLWIATDGGGLYRINRDGEVIDHYLHSASDADSLTHSRLTSLHMDRQNRLWVGTIEGLNVFDSADRIFLRIRSSNGLPNDTINCILEDNQGRIWVSTNRGLASISSDLKTFRTYTIHDGIQSNEFSHACAQGHQGTLYFGGINGYNAFQPDQIKDNPIAPPVVLTSLTQGGELLGSDPAVEDETEITLTWPDTFFEFEFSALSYSQPQANQYAYRLAEFDEGWNLIGNRHFGRYTNLPPGDFTLELAASNHDGVWSEPINSLVVHVVPPFWQTWWFRIGVTGLLVITIFTSYRLRVRNIELRSRELEQQVDERTREIEERRQQLEALYRADDEMYRYLELESVLHALVNIAVDVLHADKSAVWLWNESHDRLTLHVSRGLRVEDGWPPDLDPGDEGIESALRRGEIVSAVRFQEKQADDLPDSPLLRQMLQEGVCSYLHLPVHIEEQVFAVFSVCYTSKHDFTAEDLRLFEALAKRAGVAIENARLYEQTQEIAVMEERNRLARDLHDAVTQTLFSASLIAEALPDLWNQDPEEGKTLLGELRNLSRGALAEMRSLLLELRPTALLESNLGDLLNQLAEAAKSKQGLPVAVQIDGECKLPPEVHISLYRIAQEGLNNAIKHSQASEVRIHLQCSQDQEAGTTCARLTVQDNGVGFDPAHVSPDRLGLHILNERAQAIGAQIEITSELGQGTEITINWEGDINV
ncbi:MAG: histidine kinase [Anaerolineales bacterium]